MTRRRISIDRNVFVVLEIVVALLFALLFLLGTIYSPSIITIIFVGLSVALLVIALFSVFSGLSDFKKWLSGETHPILYKRICKDVQILNERGDAKVKYTMYCRRTYGAPLKQLVHEIFHDGKLDLKEVVLNGKSVKPEIEEFVVRKKTNGEELAPQPYHLKMKILFPTKEIEQGQEFNYGYLLDYERVYSRMTEKNVEFSAQYVLLPTRWLKMKLCISENVDLQFMPQGTKIEVIDKHEVEDLAEEQRIHRKFEPDIEPNRKIMTWEIYRPKIASTYKLFFQVEKEQKVL